MIELKNYSFYVDSKTSKGGNTYYALFLKLGDKDLLIKFLTHSEYDYILSLSK